MNENDLIYKIITLYRTARKPKFLSKKIKRGRSHYIASPTEDLFAYFLINKVKPDLIYIDQPISVDGFKAPKCPDISIVHDNVITGFCDLKMDMGWKRAGLFDLCREHNEWIKSVRGKKCKIRDGITKIDSFYRISKKVTYNTVLVSDKNINQSLLNKQLKNSEKFNPEVEVFVLTSGKHLNTYGISIENLMEKITIDKNAFKRLIKKLSGDK